MLFILKAPTNVAHFLNTSRGKLARKLCIRASRKANKLRYAATSARGVETLIAMRDMHDEELDALRMKQAKVREVYHSAVWNTERVLISANAADQGEQVRRTHLACCRIVTHRA